MYNLRHHSGLHGSADDNSALICKARAGSVLQRAELLSFSHSIRGRVDVHNVGSLSGCLRSTRQPSHVRRTSRNDAGRNGTFQKHQEMIALLTESMHSKSL